VRAAAADAVADGLFVGARNGAGGRASVGAVFAALRSRARFDFICCIGGVGDPSCCDPTFGARAERPNLRRRVPGALCATSQCRTPRTSKTLTVGGMSSTTPAPVFGHALPATPNAHTEIACRRRGNQCDLKYTEA